VGVSSLPFDQDVLQRIMSEEELEEVTKSIYIVDASSLPNVNTAREAYAVMHEAEVANALLIEETLLMTL
jgi:hypothetical protein